MSVKLAVLLFLSLCLAVTLAAPTNKKITYITPDGQPKNKHFIKEIVQLEGPPEPQPRVKLNCEHQDKKKVESGTAELGEPLKERVGASRGSNCIVVQKGEIIKVPSLRLECSKGMRADSYSGKCRSNWGR